MKAAVHRYLSRVLALALLLTNLPASPTAAAAECGAYEDGSRTSYRALRWADFQGTADRRSIGSPPTAGPVLAHVATTIRIDGSVKARERSPGQWAARVVQLCVRAFMLKDRSHYQRGETDRFDLVHEQGHFDITALYAERLRARLAPFEVVDASRKDARSMLQRRVEAAYREMMAAYQLEQRRYDVETRIRSRRNVQAQWTASIRARLSASGRRPAEAPCVYVASPYWFVGWSLPSPPIGSCEGQEG